LRQWHLSNPEELCVLLHSAVKMFAFEMTVKQRMDLDRESMASRQF
jgi:hypothetical protein